MTASDCHVGGVACPPGCPELGWPHEWDPIAAGDDCAVGGLGENPHRFGRWIGGQLVTEPMGHKVTAPYVKVGSGYACVECAAAEYADPFVAVAATREEVQDGER